VTELGDETSPSAGTTDATARSGERGDRAGYAFGTDVDASSHIPGDITDVVHHDLLKATAGP